MGSISPCNTAGLISNVSKEVATQIAKNCRRRQPPLSSDAPANIHIGYALYFRNLESLGYIFVAHVVEVAKVHKFFHISHILGKMNALNHTCRLITFFTFLF